MSTEIEHLIKLCRRRNPKAQRELYGLFAAEMMGVCMRYAPDRPTAQDMLQEGFIRVFDKLHNLREPQAAESWIYRIMVSTCINYINRKFRRYESLETLSETDDEPAFSTDPYAIDDVMAAIASLPSSQRLAFNLREVEGYEYEEIASTMGCTEANVRVLLSRAKTNLRQKLIQYA